MEASHDRSQEAAEERAAHEATEERAAHEATEQRKADEAAERTAAQEAVSEEGAASRAADALTEGGAADTAAKGVTEGAANTAAKAAHETAAAPKRVSENAADLRFGGVAQLERRRLRQFFPFLRLDARNFMHGEIDVAAKLDGHVPVAFLEALFEQRFRHRLALEPLDERHESLLVLALESVEPPVHKRVTLLRPSARTSRLS